MISNIKIILKRIFSAQLRIKIKKYRRYIVAFFKGSKKTTLKELEKILRKDLGLKKGDKIIVASSFGNLNADYSPQEVIQLLMDIVTEEGIIMMPYYPPMNSEEWAKKGYVFDMSNTKSGMGIVTNVFSRMPNVFKSMHPTKAVCVWGKDAEALIVGHENSTTPLYWDSPYGKLLKEGSKSIGLGLKNIPIFHTMEDVLSEKVDFYYYPTKFKLRLITLQQEEKEIETYIHNASILANCISPGDYVKSLNCQTYRRINFGIAFLYVIDNTDLYKKLKYDYDNGNKKLRLKQ